MPLPHLLASRRTDINALVKARDIRGLIRLLDHGNFDTQWKAALALGSMGTDATPYLLGIIGHDSINVRLGAIEALASIRDPRSIDQLITILSTDEVDEVRWAAALALGEIGDPKVIPSLLRTLKDENRYVRYGSAKALEQVGWQPANDEERAYYLIALQNWDDIKKLGRGAINPLTDMLKEKHPSIRGKIVDLLGDIGRVRTRNVCERVLRDSDGGVRWRGVLAARKCGIRISHLPWYLSKRPRAGPSAIGAAVLNFFFPGLGYHYMGLWWGFLVFASYMTILVFAQLELESVFLPFLVVYPITALVATQTYIMIKKQQDM